MGRKRAMKALKVLSVTKWITFALGFPPTLIWESSEMETVFVLVTLGFMCVSLIATIICHFIAQKYFRCPYCNKKSSGFADTVAMHELAIFKRLKQPKCPYCNQPWPSDRKIDE